MKITMILLMLFVIVSTASAQNYQIDWYVIGSGGGHSQSAYYQIDGTIGQPIVGNSSSINYRLEAGFWVGTSPTSPSCSYVPGDVNHSGNCTGLDVVYAVAYLKGGPPPSYSCECTPGHTWYVEGDVNASCSFTGLDVTYTVAYLKGGPALRPCPDCPPSMLFGAPNPIISEPEPNILR